MTTILAVDKQTILKNVFGYSSFRPKQEEIIDHLISGHDGLVIMPTGGGKSMCFQIPALMMDGMAIVVSPLIALMNDQVIALQQMGVAAEAIHSNQTEETLRDIVKRIKENKINLLYVSPERLNNSRFQEFIGAQDISFIAIDEAHCVSVWGNDFRPDYAALSSLKTSFPDKNIIALTATADKATQEDIVNQLRLNNPRTFLSSFERSNITTKSRPAIDRKGQIISFVKRNQNTSGIIYCLSRKGCEKVASDLQKVGLRAGYYHAGMDGKERSTIQRRFQEDDLQIICATIAFGMGIDKSNIRWVIHYNMPKNLEGYYQEIGRSGRDGTSAQTILFYGWGDYLMLKRFIDTSESSDHFKYVQNAKLQRMWEYASSSDCRTNFILNYFGEYKSEKCNHCDNCLNPPKKIDGSILVKKAISGVIRSNENLALNLLIDVLRGSNRREIVEGGYHTLKTYGVGRDLPFIDWKFYITQMIDKGLLRIDYTQGMKIKSTPLSLEAIKSNLPIMFKAYEKQEEKNKSKKSRVKKKTGIQLIEEELVEELKSWRLKRAREMGVPAYVVLTDRSIEQIAADKPMNVFDLEEVEGIGQKRIENYGDDLLKLIQDYLRTQTHRKNLKGKTYLETLNYYKEGDSPETIAEKRGVHAVTIYSHFAQLYTNGEDIDLFRYVNSEEVKLVKKIHDENNGLEEIAAIMDLISTPISFSKVRLALAIIKKENQ